MPRVFERSSLMKSLDWMLRVIISYVDEDDLNAADEIVDIKAALENTRYLNLRECVTKNRSMNDMLFTYSERDFIQVVRMATPSFGKLLVL